MSDVTKLETLGADALHSAKAIAYFLNTSIGRVYQMAGNPRCPIYRYDDGQYFASKTELMAYLRTKR